jgi:hypothetical protein
MEVRTETGQFALKSDAVRSVRSIRATDWVWDEFGFLADGQKLTRADLLEQWVKSGGPPGPTGGDGEGDGLTPVELAIVVETLRQALTLKANAGGAIKEKIRAALDELTRAAAVDQLPI